MALVLPYASLFMLALGIQDNQIGLLATIAMVVQVFWGLASGIVTDKLGRRFCTAFFDLIAWVIPSIIWAVANNFWYFLVAAIMNGAVQITQNSWDCLMVEDADRDQITKIYSLVGVASQLSALFMPIAAWLVSRYNLVTAVRILYLNAAVIMALKVVILYRWSSETGTGRQRRAETKGVSFWVLLAGYRGVVSKLIVSSKGALFSLAIMAIVAAVNLVYGTFWPIVITQRLGVPDNLLPFFPMVRSVFSIIFLFSVIPRFTAMTELRKATVLGFIAHLVGNAILIAIPVHHSGPNLATYLFLLLGLVVDSLAAGLLYMLSESLVALHVDRAERSRVMAIQRTLVMLVAAPFGWIGGWLSSLNRIYPILLTALLLAVGLMLAATRWVATEAGDGLLAE